MQKLGFSTLENYAGPTITNNIAPFHFASTLRAFLCFTQDPTLPEKPLVLDW
jgi:hypothetical protein